jgi:hypothetical protein
MHPCWRFCFLAFAILGMEPRASCMLTMCSAAELPTPAFSD